MQRRTEISELIHCLENGINLDRVFYKKQAPIDLKQCTMYFKKSYMYMHVFI